MFWSLELEFQYDSNAGLLDIASFTTEEMEYHGEGEESPSHSHNYYSSGIPQASGQALLMETSSAHWFLQSEIKICRSREESQYCFDGCG
jgi:hypothetical protein